MDKVEFSATAGGFGKTGRVGRSKRKHGNSSSLFLFFLLLLPPFFTFFSSPFLSSALFLLHSPLFSTPFHPLLFLFAIFTSCSYFFLLSSSTLPPPHLFLVPPLLFFLLSPPFLSFFPHLFRSADICFCVFLCFSLPKGGI